jgi:hypothetical protein
MRLARLAPRADLGGRPGAARGYGTDDPLGDVLAPGYFGLARALLRPGELIYVSSVPRPAGRVERAEMRLALVMVRSDAGRPDRADGSTRLAPGAHHPGLLGAARVQDFGRPGAPASVTDHAGAPAPAPAPITRGRGRPPGSRTRKPAATPIGSSSNAPPQA